MAIALVGAGAAFVRLVQPLARVRWFPLRHAVIGLGRPGHQTRVILVTVGLGCFFILATHLVERTLAARLSLDLRPDAPDLFFVDVQDDQRAGVEALLAARTRRARPGCCRWRGPASPASAAAIVNLDSVEAVRERGGLSREFVITWRDRLASNEKVVEGRFWDAPTTGEPEVSIEAGMRDRDLRLGDRIRFDILGRSIAARVTSVREVDWDDPREGGFIFVFRPGPLDRVAARLPGHRPRPRRARRARPPAARPGRRLAERLGDRRARGDRHDQRGSCRWRRSASASSAPWRSSAA